MAFGTLKGFAAIVAVSIVLWLVSLRSKNVGIIDIFWSLFFVVMAGFDFFDGTGLPARMALVLGLVALWGTRLAAHLYVRSRGQGEDSRYAEMRHRHGRAWPILSLPYIFLAQPLLAWAIALPIHSAMSRGSSTPLGPLDLLGTAFFIFGLTFETVADWQLRRFKSGGANKGKVMASGLWQYSRHPNYFGEFVLWWGLGLIALSTGAVVSLVGPALLTLLLLRVSGVTLMESTIRERRPDYRAYQEITNAFFPGPPRGKAAHATR